MTDIVIPISIFKKILNYIDTHSVNEHTRISIRETSCGIGNSYEVKISQTRHNDIAGFESGIYAIFSDMENW
jgi:hypothetical protein